MLISRIRACIASFGIAEPDNCYSGKMPDRREKCIGVYPLKPEKRRNTIGGRENQSYGIKSVSILLHWNKNQPETERAALALQEKLLTCREYQTEEERIKFIQVHYEEPVFLGTDEAGIYEYVIECDIYYGKGSA